MVSISVLVANVVVTMLLCYCCCVTTVRALPSGFIDEGVVTRDAIITGTFVPNPRNQNKPMLVLSSKNGQIYAVEDPDNSEDDVPIGDISSMLCVNGERGLQSIVPHPNFIENRYIYLFFSRFVTDCPEDIVSGPPNRVSRFVMNAETLEIDLSTEFIILETSAAPKKMHNGGAMAFGNDGYLYITTGDGGMREPSYSQDLSVLFGKVLRVDENGDVPTDNPYTSTNGGTGVACGKNNGVPPSGSSDDAVCEEIFAHGLRNPFRLEMNSNAVDRVLFVIGDVGASQWEEISFGGSDYIGANYGWPVHEGPCLIGSTKNCPIPDGNITEPHYYYEHTADTEGGCIVGSTFVPEKLGWPEQYKYLFIDFIFGAIYNLVEDPSRECRECIPPVPGYYNETFYEFDNEDNLLLDVFFGPYQDTEALYVISRGPGQSIRRIRYTGIDNYGPVANITVSSAIVDIGEVIMFDGSLSSDPEAENITYLWDFGDNITSTEISPEHSYEFFGLYTVTLTVTDSLNQTDQVYIYITVGEPPIANMTSPVEGSRFSVGQEILVSGTATDASGVTLLDNQISWEVRQHHNEHFHPFLDKISGNNFKLDPAPSPEDYLAAESSYLEIIMYATDANGVTTSISRIITPKKVFLLVDSVPRGLQILVDEYVVVTPKNVTSWENHKLHLNALDQENNAFQSWSIGGDRKTNYTVPARQVTNPTILATFINSTYVPTTSPIGDVIPPATSPITSPESAPVTPPVVAPVPVPVIVPVAFPVMVPVAVTEEPSTFFAPAVAPIIAPSPPSVETPTIDFSTSNAMSHLHRFVSSRWLFTTGTIFLLFV